MKEIDKDITTVKVGIIMHGTNCSGAMGSGVAGAIKKKWPVVYEGFKTLTPSPKLLGKIQLVQVENSVFVVNCFTQIKYGNDGERYADPEAVAKCLHQVVTLATVHDYNIYMPKIGCGLGGLDWATEVLPIVEMADETLNRATNRTREIIVCNWG